MIADRITRLNRDISEAMERTNKVEKKLQDLATAWSLQISTSVFGEQLNKVQEELKQEVEGLKSVVDRLTK